MAINVIAKAAQRIIRASDRLATSDIARTLGANMPTIDLRIINNQQVRRRIERLPQKVQNQVIKNVFRKHAKTLKTEAMQRAPSGDTGQLRSSIRVGTLGSKKLGVGAKVTVGRNLPDGRASFLELGTKHIEPRRYMRGTFDDQRSTIERDLTGDFVDAYLKLVSKGVKQR